MKILKENGSIYNIFDCNRFSIINFFFDLDELYGIWWEDKCSGIIGDVLDSLGF